MLLKVKFIVLNNLLRLYFTSTKRKKTHVQSKVKYKWKN